MQDVIRFENVSVEYEPGRPALRDVSLEIRRGQRVAVIGPSGGGKSTLAALLLRFLEPGNGQIMVDGSPMVEIPPEAWRKGLAWVSQNPYLFNDTIDANIRLGCPDASQEAVIRAAKMAEADEFIRSFPDGYKTQIGERGARLSGGQAQRIALARAFLKGAHFIILDEATANLDAETEASLQAALERLLQDRTCLVIAHRLNTVRDADQIIVLDQGQICQSGTHQQLMEQGGLYQKMVLMGHGFSAGMAGDAAMTSDSPSQKSCSEDPAVNNPVNGVLPSYGFVRKDPLPVLGRLVRFVTGIWKWVALSTIAGAATVLSGVGLMATSAYIISAAALHPSIALLAVPIVGVRFFGIARGVFRYLERYVSHQATFLLLARLRVWFYQALEPLAPARLMRYRSGDLLTRMLGDIQSLDNLYVRGFAPPLAALIALAAVAWYFSRFAPSLAWFLGCFWLAAGLFLPLVARKLGQLPGRRMIVERAELNAVTIDYLQGLSDLQAFSQSQATADRVGERGNDLLRTQEQMAKLNSLQNMVVSQLSGLGILAVLVLAIPQITRGQIDGVYLAVIALAALTSFEAVNPLPTAAQHLENNIQAASRLFEVVDAEPDVTDPAEAISPHPSFDLQVRGLNFSYPGGGEVLRGINFDLPQGKRIGIVGPSGSGKSTLVNLLLRFYDTSPGQILLSGKDFRLFNQEMIRQKIAVVPQQVYLFNLSLRENLCIGNIGCTEEEIAEVVKTAQLNDLIRSLPEGMETWLGEQGVRFSGGERQRIAIARALLHLQATGAGGLLILDEGTAHLDAEMERQVLRSIMEHTRGHSVLMISHHLVGMDAMDEILVLNKGEVVERGTHADLLNSNGVYNRIWQIQNNMIPEE